MSKQTETVSGFTPGPWKRLALGEDETPKDWWRMSFRIKSGSRPLASVNIFAGNPENSHKNDVREGEANARLIAAAPAMFEALHTLIRHEALPLDCFTVARNAILKAQGKPL